MASTTPIKPKYITILGSTGTIGQNTLDLISRNREKFSVIAMTGNHNIDLLAKQAIEFNAKFVATAATDQYQNLKNALSGTGIECAAGEEAILEAATRPVDLTMAAIVGVAGLKPTLKALESCKTLALANKECLVSAGQIFMKKARKFGVNLIPVDSEHSAAFQCLNGQDQNTISKLTLTASGGPFRTLTSDQLSTVTRDQALKHPNWEMGAKISIDSATMMNKGLELIEARYLFDLKAEQIDMVIHPQSIIHCLVSFMDGSMIAQLSEPDMRIPIAYSLSWPERMETPIAAVNLADLGQMTFEPGDETRFPCLRLAREVLENDDQSAPVLNAANEIAVDAFLKDRCSFRDIPQLIESVLEKMRPGLSRSANPDLNDILDIDAQTRQISLEYLKQAV